MLYCPASFIPWQWSLVGVSLRRSTGTVKLFLNAQVITRNIMPPGYTHQTSGPIRMGRVKMDERNFGWVSLASGILISMVLTNNNANELI